MKKCAVTMGTQHQSYEKEFAAMREMGVEPHWYETEIDGSLDPEVVIRYCKGYDYVIAGGEIWNRQVLEALKGDLKLLIRNGVGYDQVDVQAATELGIPVAIMPGANAGAVAELAVAMMLDLIRNVSKINNMMHQGNSTDSYYSTNSLWGKTVGLLGFGNIAKNVVKLLQGFDCKFIAYDIFHDEAFAKQYGVTFGTMEEVLRESDVVSVHLPALPETHWTINRDTLAMMKPNAILINTSRGALVCADDLAEALKKGQIAGAGLDVFEGERGDALPMGHQFLGMENVILTPHVASATFEAYSIMMYRGIESIRCHMEGKPIPGLLNPDYVKYQ
jgi:phosphoglycerate dehydrogenase-like enzyme